MRRVLAVSWLVIALGCTGVWNMLNVGPFRTYTEQLALPHGLTVTDCSMFESTRDGSCVLEGDAAAVEAFLEAHTASVAPPPGKHGEPCFARYRFGSEVDGPTRVYDLDPATLPTNQDNVHVLRVLRIDGALCVSLSYPYG